MDAVRDGIQFVRGAAHRTDRYAIGEVLGVGSDIGEVGIRPPALHDEAAVLIQRGMRPQPNQVGQSKLVINAG